MKAAQVMHDALDEDTAPAEPMESYLLERPALMLTFLDVAERYSRAQERVPARVQRFSA